MKKRIERSLSEKGLSLGSEKIDKIYEYYLLMRKFSEKMNLISRRDFDGNFINLTLISVFLYREILKEKAKIIDVGSGAGFPSVVGKIVREDDEILFVEPGKRAYFLEEVLKNFGFKGVKVVKRSFKEVFHELKVKNEKFDYTVLWGLKGKEKILNETEKIVKIGNLFITGSEEKEKVKSFSQRKGRKFFAKKIPFKTKLYIVISHNVPCGTGEL